MNRIIYFSNALKIVLLLVVLASCQTNKKESKIDLPTKIQTSITNEHIRIKGTKVLVKVPSDYFPIEEMMRYQKKDNLYFQVVSVQKSFFEFKKYFTKENIESKGIKIGIIHPLKFNNFDALITEGPSKIPNEEKLVFAFGNDDFMVTILGVYPQNNKKAKQELIDIFQNIVYQEDFENNPFELLNFTFDKSITGFKYATQLSNSFIFTEDGNTDSMTTFSNTISVGAFPKVTKNKGIEFIESIITNLKNNGAELASQNIESKNIGKYPALILETPTQFENREGITYAVWLDLESSSVFFMASSFDNKLEMVEKYKQTVETIREK